MNHKLQILNFLGWLIDGDIAITNTGEILKLSTINFENDSNFQNVVIDHIENMGYSVNTFSTYLAGHEKPLYYTVIETKKGIEIVSTDFNTSRQYATYEGICDFLNNLI